MPISNLKGGPRVYRTIDEVSGEGDVDFYEAPSWLAPVGKMFET